jgi:phosphoserine phosphatase RsbU/P
MLTDTNTLPQTRHPLHDATILVAEDDRLNRKLLLDTLQHHGFRQVTMVHNGAQAIEYLHAFTPDLIITDLLMPEVDGFALCRKVRSTPHLRDIPIIALTGVEGESERLYAFELGASDVLRKPAKDAELIARCHLQLEKRHILRDLQEYRTRMEEDLSHARDMQNLLLPDATAIERTEQQFQLSIRSVFSPSSIIGGDFWGMHTLRQKKLAFYIGDFTGHGVTAAINVFRASLLMERLPMGVLSQPRQCLAQLNRQLHAMLPVQQFATMFYGVLDTTRNTLCYCIAGCPPPLILRAHGQSQLLHGQGMPLAVTATTRYAAHTVPFMPGDALLLYSDALIETADAQQRYLHINTVAERLNAIPSHKRTGDGLLQTVLDAFSTHSACGLKDDLTINVYLRHDSR